jgi:hypothetical protein
MKSQFSFSVLLFATMFWVIWVAGVVIAKGFCSTVVGMFFFPWSWYLVIEKIMKGMGWL